MAEPRNLVVCLDGSTMGAVLGRIAATADTAAPYRPELAGRGRPLPIEGG